MSATTAHDKKSNRLEVFDKSLLNSNQSAVKATSLEQVLRPCYRFTVHGFGPSLSNLETAEFLAYALLRTAMVRLRFLIEEASQGCSLLRDSTTTDPSMSLELPIVDMPCVRCQYEVSTLILIQITLEHVLSCLSYELELACDDA